MSYQRRRGLPLKIWRSHEVADARGNRVFKIDWDTPPYEVTGAAIPQRSSRAEVPGQQEINVVRLLVSASLEGVDLWSRVQYDGQMWDVVSPPAHHHGTRHVRHWTIDIRERP